MWKCPALAANSSKDAAAETVSSLGRDLPMLSSTRLLAAGALPSDFDSTSLRLLHGPMATADGEQQRRPSRSVTRRIEFATEMACRYWLG